MIVNYTTYFEDGTSDVTAIEKPAGAHPDSVAAVRAAIKEAERAGKRVARIGRSRVAFGKIIDTGVHSRSEWERLWRVSRLPQIPF